MESRTVPSEDSTNIQAVPNAPAHRGAVGLAQTLEDLVGGAEADLRAGRQLEIQPGSIGAVARDLPGAQVPPLTLKRAGHRLWQACSDATAVTPPLLQGAAAAGTREFACELIQTGMARTGGWPASDQFDLILQWAVTGKAWLDLQEYNAAVRCLGRSSAALDGYAKEGPSRETPESELERLHEATLQTQLWMAQALVKAGNHEQAFLALSKAVTLQKSCPSLAAVSQGLLLRTCREQAGLHRQCGDCRLAADVLTLALSLLPPTDGPKAARARPERAELLQQLAQCFSDLREHDTAIARAREAANLEPQGSSGQARALRTLLAVLCAPGAASSAAGHDGEGIRDAALEFVTHRRAKLTDCLSVARDLADRGLDAACLACLARLRARLRSDPEELGIAWLFAAQILAGRVEELCGGGKEGHDEDQARKEEAAVERLSELLDEVEAASDRPTTLSEKLAALLWNLGEALCRRGHPQAATVWMNRALPFLAEVGRSGAGWRALAKCHRSAGEAGQARRCAETALAHDPTDAHAAVFVLLDAAEHGEADVVSDLLAKTCAKEFSFSVAQAAYVVAMLGEQPPSPIFLECLKLLLKCIKEDPTTAVELGISQEWTLRSLLVAAAACHKPSACLAEYLDEAHQLASSSSETIDLCWFFEFAWRKALAMAEQKAFADSVVMFRSAHALVQNCRGSSSWDEAWCAVAAVQAMFQAARCETVAAEAEKLKQSALQWVERARCSVQKLGDTGKVTTSVTQTLAVLHFEALCLLRSPMLNTMAQALIGAAAPGDSDAPSVALLARLALEAGNADVCAICLRTYLRLASCSDKEKAGKNLATARRELLGLQDPVVSRRGADGQSTGDDLADACEEVMHHLQEREEALWLAAAAWNSGVELAAGYGAQDAAGTGKGAASKRSLRAGLDLLGRLSCVGLETTHETGKLGELHGKLSKSFAAWVEAV